MARKRYKPYKVSFTPVETPKPQLPRFVKSRWWNDMIYAALLTPFVFAAIHGLYAAYRALSQ